MLTTLLGLYWEYIGGAGCRRIALLAFVLLVLVPVAGALLAAQD